jgi:hypothetical protein
MREAHESVEWPILFLENYPEDSEKFSLIMVISPGDTDGSFQGIFPITITVLQRSALLKMPG